MNGVLDLVDKYVRLSYVINKLNGQIHNVMPNCYYCQGKKLTLEDAIRKIENICPGRIVTCDSLEACLEVGREILNSISNSIVQDISALSLEEKISIREEIEQKASDLFCKATVVSNKREYAISRNNEAILAQNWELEKKTDEIIKETNSKFELLNYYYVTLSNFVCYFKGLTGKKIVK